jgi:hypothetical protein
MNLAPKYRNAVILESGTHLTLISLRGNEYWVKTSELYLSEPEPEPLEVVRRVKISAGVRRSWRSRRGLNDVTETRAVDL